MELTDFERPDRFKTLHLAQRYLRQRGARRDTFGADVFRDPAWDIILDLYCAEALDRKVSIMDACVAARVPTTTGLRYVNRLIAARLVARRGDTCDRRRTLLTLTTKAVEAVEKWLSATWSEIGDAR